MGFTLTGDADFRGMLVIGTAASSSAANALRLTDGKPQQSTEYCHTHIGAPTELPWWSFGSERQASFPLSIRDERVRSGECNSTCSAWLVVSTLSGRVVLKRGE